MGNILEAPILIGKFQGEVVLLPRIPMIPSDSPIPFKCLQFPIRLAFAMIINKSQGELLTSLRKKAVLVLRLKRAIIHPNDQVTTVQIADFSYRKLLYTNTGHLERSSG
ncbi:ATP-dependent DNA helicase [Trichonephila clavipes]|nr:ATP-dependent DNA helicase [Trichonephila clavipes]